MVYKIHVNIFQYVVTGAGLISLLDKTQIWQNMGNTLAPALHIKPNDTFFG